MLKLLRLYSYHDDVLDTCCQVLYCMILNRISSWPHGPNKSPSTTTSSSHLPSSTRLPAYCSSSSVSPSSFPLHLRPSSNPSVCLTSHWLYTPQTRYSPASSSPRS